MTPQGNNQNHWLDTQQQDYWPIGQEPIHIDNVFDGPDTRSTAGGVILPQFPSSGTRSDGQGFQGPTNPAFGQMDPQQPQMMTDAGQGHQMPYNATTYQSSGYPVPSSQPATLPSFNSNTGLHDDVNQDPFISYRDRSLSLAVFPGSAGSSPQYLSDANDVFASTQARRLLSDIPSDIQQGNTHGFTDDTAARNTQKFVQEQHNDRHSSRSEKKKKHRKMMKNIDETITNPQPTGGTSQRQPSTKWSVPKSHYHTHDGDTYEQSDDIYYPDAADDYSSPGSH